MSKKSKRNERNALPHESYVYKGLNKEQRKLVRNKLFSILSPLPALIPQAEKLRLILEIRKELGLYPQQNARQWIDLATHKVIDQNATSEYLQDIFFRHYNKDACKLQRVEDNKNKPFLRKRKPDVTPR